MPGQYGMYSITTHVGTARTVFRAARRVYALKRRKPRAACFGNRGFQSFLNNVARPAAMPNSRRRRASIVSHQAGPRHGTMAPMLNSPILAPPAAGHTSALSQDLRGRLIAAVEAGKSRRAAEALRSRRDGCDTLGRDCLPRPAAGGRGTRDPAFAQRGSNAGACEIATALGS
jgi:hypothetical protein